MSCDFVCIHLTCWTWFNYHLCSLLLPWDLFLLPNTLLLFLFSMKVILSVKFRLKLVWGRVLWTGLAKKWKGIRKTILEVILPSYLLAIKQLLFAKSPLESLIMLFSRECHGFLPLKWLVYRLNISSKVKILAKVISIIFFWVQIFCENLLKWFPMISISMSISETDFQIVENRKRKRKTANSDVFAYSVPQGFDPPTHQDWKHTSLLLDKFQTNFWWWIF